MRSGTPGHRLVQVGDRVFTLIVPGGDVEPDAVDRLITTMATALG